jgi:hypothetical protein
MLTRAQCSTSRFETVLYSRNSPSRKPAGVYKSKRSEVVDSRISQKIPPLFLRKIRNAQLLCKSLVAYHDERFVQIAAEFLRALHHAEAGRDLSAP